MKAVKIGIIMILTLQSIYSEKVKSWYIERTMKKDIIRTMPGNLECSNISNAVKEKENCFCPAEPRGCRLQGKRDHAKVS